MGWIYTNKPNGKSIREFFEKRFNFEENDRYGKIIDLAVVNLRTAYIAYECGTATSKGVVALICLLDYVPKDYYNFGYKDMEESMGPYQCDCPERILKLLTPTDNEWAQNWRNKCWENIKRKKARPKLTKGLKIRFAEPINFNIFGPQQEFIVIDARRGIFESPNVYGTFKIPRKIINNRKWEIVNNNALIS